MQSIFDNMSGQFNANDPEENLIIEQLRIREAWDEKVQAKQPTSIYSDDQQLEINTEVIISAHQIFVHEIAEYSLKNKLLTKVADNLRYAYDRRGFFFPRPQASAIADKYQVNDETRIKIMGILLWGASCYDLHVPLLLTKKDDGKEFDFFFAFKLAGMEALDCDAFLEHQLSLNFENKIDKFCHYLQALVRQYQSSELFQLDTAVVETIREWINMKLPPTSEPVRIECVKISGILTDRHYNAFLDHLEGVLNAGIEPKIRRQDVELLKAHGLAIPIEENPAKIMLRLKKGDKEVLYHYFHALWENHGDLRGDVEKIEIARYLCGWFTNFEKAKPESIAEQLRSNYKIKEEVTRLFFK